MSESFSTTSQHFPYPDGVVGLMLLHTFHSGPLSLVVYVIPARMTVPKLEPKHDRAYLVQLHDLQS